MSFKSWFLDRLQTVGGAVTRADLGDARAPHARGGEPALAALETRDARPEPALDEVLHLGAYGPLIAAIRDELEHFVASQVRLHLAIADRDRFLLTSIAVRAPADDERRRQLERFMREFKPEQLKRYLVRELIAGLPNASALDLSQFAGLVDADAAERAPADGDYRELIAALTAAPASSAPRPYRVELVGRWTELDAPAVHALAGSAARQGTPATPLATGARFEFDVEDADGRRRVVLPAVVPERRYLVGKGEGCDVRVNGAFASRRHAEVWLEGGAWWAADAGSTNGIRVEGSPVSEPAKDGLHAQPMRLAPGDRLVLSTRAEGPAADYPWIALRALSSAPPGTRVTPIASAAVPKTPLTSVMAPGEARTAWKVTLTQAQGVRTLEVDPAALPVRVGRSRSQTLVVDRVHDGVSGHHLEIVALDDHGAHIVVHGDNGVLVDGVPHACGSRLAWKPGETLVLGASARDACTLVLTRAGEAG
ncbi:MAG TPA: FHA domain-containing protein [Caldimonas sp.]|nr:FHA domain-containing protein [Caldimonas sp.]